ncbi:nitrite reductase (NADH) large subunit [Wenyingzhuangia heitensis]|uniref:Nitrite reductase (NADH) large subunit n=1 Tax=Wenyingzhuangia heitensis TaxID=1487859 RepID=A0ABX0U9D4_9FLAO|nr:nitrite reductase large subunit NirB [Wenyingzhuangia heitensis]NIJ44395.1 nitrite reductase (NADH) large subunit [Wenyingzhuangia heitensis]
MKTILVIGNGMVGYKFCEKLMAKSESDNYKVIVFGEEPRPAYDRVHLSEYFADQNAERLSMAPRSWYEENNIELITNERVTDVHRASKTITTINDKEYIYDYLVLATGSSAFVPPIPGVEKEGVFVYRTIEDLDATMAYVAKIKSQKPDGKAAILGGGLLGLEAGKAIIDMGLETSVVEFAPRLMPRQLDNEASQVLQNKLEALGIDILLNKGTQNIEGDKAITGMKFSENETLPVDMLLVSAGIRPRDELAKTCGLEVGTRGGILVTNNMKTSDDSIYAIGECALLNQMIYGLVAPGYDMAGVAVDNILGDEALMPSAIDMSTKLKLSGIDVASFGDALNEAKESESIVYENKFQGIYKKINVSKDGKKLLGGILVGDASDYNMLHQIFLNGMAIPENPEDLILGARGGEEASFGSALDLPDSAVVCSCEAVTKGQICCSVTEDGNEDLASVVAATKATTGCGGCKPMVTDLVTETLKSMGKVVKDVICDHFQYSRQELYSILKVKKVTSFDEALDACGEGKGCELCQPAVSSILASLYNHTPNKEDVSQDSNDKFLANIQRNGTYSVVPRIAGGEVTPEQLIVLGQIGKKYNLYTKITGGARIDFFGAELNDLPAIWTELIAEGFESGHAYGKSLRTVKSCVGSTWCRYGMDESITFAIELENRYKGLRSPHKIKGGVSGCIRECAEARGKDFGIIAVEGGWNLYVCGNGGATPRHAELLAEQIDNETVVKYLDRFLIYYIETAAPLMRTAAWLDKLEGGIEQLKKVVVEDSLGINAELEAQMDLLVDAYECEWKQVVESDTMKDRFSHFVNSDDRDDNIAFVPMRDQKMPELWK